MLQTILSYVVGRSNPQDPYIFHYHDGTRKRSADPTAIEQTLIEYLGEDWRETLKELDKPIPYGAIGAQMDDCKEKRGKLYKDVLAAIDAAFKVHPYTDNDGLASPSGLIEGFREGLLKGYIRFCLDLVRLARPFANAQSRASPSPVSPPPPSGQASSSPEKESPPPAPGISEGLLHSQS